MITLIRLHPAATLDHAGLIPDFLDEADPRPVKEQFHERYAHGGGWFPMTGFTKDARTHVLHYPGDPPFLPLLGITFRDELVVIYQHSIVAIIQKDGSCEVARMD